MLITKRGEVTKQGFCKILGRKLRPRGSLLLEFSKKNGMGREVIPTLTTFSANSARRLDPQDRIPITSYWTSQIGLFWCWIRQKLKFTMLSQPSPLFSFINLRLTFGNDDDYGKTTFTSY